MTTVLALGAAGVLMLGIVVLAGHRMLRTADGGGGGVVDGLGSFIDVFDPARARAEDDLRSHRNQGELLPLPEDDDRPVEVDLQRNTVRIRRP